MILRAMVKDRQSSVWRRIKDSIASGNVEYVKDIYKAEDLTYNVKVDYTNDTGLHLAVIEGQGYISKYFIDQGADKESKNYLGYTPLLTAVREERRKMAKLLLECGADVNAKNIEGDTPLLIAASRICD